MKLPAWLVHLVAVTQCAHCRLGTIVEYRKDTSEFVHTLRSEIPTSIPGRKSWAFTHALCGAHQFRKKWSGA